MTEIKPTIPPGRLSNGITSSYVHVSPISGRNKAHALPNAVPISKSPIKKLNLLWIYLSIIV